MQKINMMHLKNADALIIATEWNEFRTLILIKDRFD